MRMWNKPDRQNGMDMRIKCHPIRTLYPNKIIVSNKLLGLLGLGLGFGSGLILYA